jgi:nicotinate-nucleotide adenylyltransferase
MNIAIFGGSFNPPHLGHRQAAMAAAEELRPDKLLVVPANIPPHKAVEDGGPAPEERAELCRLNFSCVPGAEVSGVEIERQGKSYTSDTLRELMGAYPGAKFTFIVGTDMLLTFEEWHDFRFLLENMRLAVLARDDGDEARIRSHAEYLTKKYGADVVFIEKRPVPMSSREIRGLLRVRSGRTYLDDGVYTRIIRNRDYAAKAELDWLRQKAYPMLKPKRVAHVAGVESEAVRLARRWGADPDTAAEAGILHDITKKLSLDEQLILCGKYGIINDNVERENVKLLHAKTGAAVARDLFGADEEVCSAIRWHTTGKPDMTLLEKIIYLADYIEPNRDFPGVDELRKLTYEDIDKAMALGLEMSLADIRSYGEEPHHITAEACEWYSRKE